MPEETSAAVVNPSADPALAPGTSPATDGVGTPECPAFKRRPALFIAALVLFASWMALLIYWALQVRHATH